MHFLEKLLEERLWLQNNFVLSVTCFFLSFLLCCCFIFTYVFLFFCYAFLFFVFWTTYIKGIFLGMLVGFVFFTFWKEICVFLFFIWCINFLCFSYIDMQLELQFFIYIFFGNDNISQKNCCIVINNLYSTMIFLFFCERLKNLSKTNQAALARTTTKKMEVWSIQ